MYQSRPHAIGGAIYVYKTETIVYAFYLQDVK